jgi:hypothetical protein
VTSTRQRLILPLRAPSALLLGVGVLVAVQSLAWRGATFPGFFVLPNRVVPSAGLPDWHGALDGRPLYQTTLLAVDDLPVRDATEAYARAARHGRGDAVAYTFAREGAVETRSIPARTFTSADYQAIFFAYGATGLAFLLLAALAAERWRAGELYRALAMAGWVNAAFTFTAVDLYGPGHFFRLHALAEALLPAVATHLALACPRDRIARHPGLLALVYGVGLALAAVYQLFLHEPGAYSAIHNTAQALCAPPVLALAVLLALEVGAPRPALGRAVPRLLAGTLAGIVVPAIVLGISGITGGRFAVNVAASIGFVFPLACVAALWGPALRARVTLPGPTPTSA